jgi:hypothetical protein
MFGRNIYKCHVTTIILFKVFLVWLKSSCLSINNLFNCDFFVISFMVFSEEPIITVLLSNHSELYQRHLFYVKIQLKLNPILDSSMVMSSWYHPHQYAFEFVNNGQMIH